MIESNRTPTNESPHGAFPQPIDLLCRLANARLPIRIVDDGDIETLRILKLAGSIKAAIPEATRLPGGLNQSHRQLPATVDEITTIGRSLLYRFANHRPLAHSYAQFL
jgi:hypothetical protein